MAWPEKDLQEHEIVLFEQLIAQRQQGTPIAYLTGEKEFWSLPFNVSTDTLIPRPETELLVETVLSIFNGKKNISLIDLGTGCGTIAIALAKTQPRWKITATDISDNALEIAHRNANLHALDNIEFISSNWFSSLENQTFDAVISNPPYIAKNDVHLKQGDVRFEPQNALISGSSGMDDINKITSHAKNHLNDDGWLLLEHGYDQKELVLDCLNHSGFINITQKDDLSGNPRVTLGQYKKS